MRAPLVVSLFLLSALVVSSSTSKTRQSTTKPYLFSHPASEKLPPDLTDRLYGQQPSAAATDTFELARFTFDLPSAGPDPQGWISVDLTTSQVGTRFHIADGTELNGGQFGTLLPLEGAQSTWCGAVPSDDPPFCSYATLPGYGNSWNQVFVSKTFGCDSVRVHYKVQWDSENGYDFTFVEYLDAAASIWLPLPVNSGKGYYDGQGASDEVLAFGTANGSTRVRFRFESDGAWSDEDGLYSTDGAVLVDSVTVECYSGGELTETFFEDFEGETPGAIVTSDGCWVAEAGPVPGYGDFAALYPGISVLQEDPCVINLSYLWGFFADPLIAGYGCHTPDPRPDQGVVPFVNDDGLYINNQIWSPQIPITGAGSEFLLSFQVYRDLPLDNLVFYNWAVRSFVTDCPEEWRDFGSGIHYGAQRDFFEARFQIGSLIEIGATAVQISLGVWDACFVWCSIFGSGACHSHAPLFDDVRLVRVNKTGPQYSVRHLDLFQDTFAEDGTLTGHARADAAVDILPATSPGLQPGDSIALTVVDPTAPLAADAFTGVGPAVYAYVTVAPANQPGKLGGNLEAPEARSIGKRYPFVGDVLAEGVTWHRFRMDSSITRSGLVLQDRYCFDLNDAVLNPGDTIHYFFAATNISSESSYFSRAFQGQGADFTTSTMTDAIASPMEFTVLPAGGWRRGGDILYVDDADDRGDAVPLHLYFASAFETMGISDLIDRYDVLSPSSMVGNGPASRVTDALVQIVGCYKNILWGSGTLSRGLIGDGTGQPEKSDDFDLLFTFLDQHPDNPGLFITGDNNAEEWISLSGSGAVNLKSTYMNFNLLSGDHVALDGEVSPTLSAVSPTFTHAGVPDEFVAFGGCPFINQFDVLQPTGLARADLVSAQSGNAYLISQATSSSIGSTARVVLSGFSLHHAHDTEPRFPFARVEILKDVLVFFQNVPPVVVGVDPEPRLTAYLGDAYPNPFNPTTTIRYAIERRGHVSLEIYNVAGQLVRTLVDGELSPRPEGFTVTWRGDSDSGQPVASGVYFYRLVTEDFEKTKKMVLLK